MCYCECFCVLEVRSSALRTRTRIPISIGWVIIQCDWCLYEKTTLGYQDIHTGRTPWEWEGSQLQTEEGNLEQILPSQTVEGANLADTFISDLKPPKQWDNTLVLFKHPVGSALLWQPQHTNPCLMTSVYIFLARRVSLATPNIKGGRANVYSWTQSIRSIRILLI